MTSSGPVAAWARCQARRSGSRSASVTAARGPVRLAPLGRAGRAIRRGARERVAEAQVLVDVHQPGGHCRGRRGGGHAQLPRRRPQPLRLGQRLQGRDQQQLAGVRRERVQPPPEAHLDPGRDREGGGHADPDRQLGWGKPSGQLDERQRIAAGLDHDPVADALVERAFRWPWRAAPVRHRARGRRRRAPGARPAHASPRASRRAGRLGRRAAGARRTRAPAPTPGRAIARRRSRTAAAAPAPRPRAG